MNLDHPVEPLAFCAHDPLVALDILGIAHHEQIRCEAWLGRIVGRQILSNVDLAPLLREVATQCIERAELGIEPNLKISRIDPEAETKAYVDNVMSTRGAKLDEQGRALLAEDLRSPCWEEVAVFGAFSRLVREAGKSFVVLDTAPTGHSLLLLDATGAYHRQTVAAYKAAYSGRIETPLMRLGNPTYTKVLIVALAETTPVTEAAGLQADLRRAGIEPFAWIINSSLAAAGSTDPLLRQRIAGERTQIAAVQRRHARRVVVVPWQIEEPVGSERLHRLAHAGTPSSDRPELGAVAVSS